jgi:hypothetical protein
MMKKRISRFLLLHKALPLPLPDFEKVVFGISSLCPLATASAFERISFIFPIYRIIHHRALLGEHENSSYKNRSPAVRTQEAKWRFSRNEFDSIFIIYGNYQPG